MFHELIKVSKDGNVFLDDNTISVLPKLFDVYKTNGMGSKMVKWIVAMYDNESPYRKLPEEERKRTVCFAIFNKEKHPKLNHKKVKDAISEYRKLNFDPLIDQYQAMVEKSYALTKIYREIEPSRENFDVVNDYQVKMEKAAQSRDRIKKLILEDQNSQSKIFGTEADSLSFLEQGQRMDDND